MNKYSNNHSKMNIDVTPLPAQGTEESDSIAVEGDQLFAIPAELKQYLYDIISKHNPAHFFDYMEKIKPLNILIIGETIIDEYCYCETIGKSGKEPILASRYLSSEQFAGGVLAVANHLSGYSNQVGVLTFLGTINSQQGFIESKLNKKVNRHFLYVENEPTIVKRRYVEKYPLQKLFEVYEMNNCRENPSCDQELCAKLEELLPQQDVVIVADYGHGMIDEKAVDIICDKAPFLAVNTQVNADNRGFNTVSKYHRADYICISENEIRLEARSRHKDIELIIESISDKLNCPKLLVTQGSEGCLTYNREQGFFKAPAYTQHYVDRIGAGDAVLSLTSPLVKLGMPAEMLGLVGNVIGALAVAVMGNKEPVKKEDLIKYMNGLFDIVSKG